MTTPKTPDLISPVTKSRTLGASKVRCEILLVDLTSEQLWSKRQPAGDAGQVADDGDAHHHDGRRQHAGQDQEPDRD